jgi:hypothetical protein
VVQRFNGFAFWVAGCLALVICDWAHAQCSSVKNPDSTVSGVQVRYVSGSPGISDGMINSAISLWSSGCPGDMGTDFPTLVGGGSGGLTYTVFAGGHNSADADCGRFSGLTITIFASATENGNRRDCGNMTMNLGHEIGHSLGLADAPAGAQCQNFIMAWLTPGNLYSRSVQPEECSKVDSHWQMAGESQGGGVSTPPPCV